MEPEYLALGSAFGYSVVDAAGCRLSLSVSMNSSQEWFIISTKSTHVSAHPTTTITNLYHRDLRKQKADIALT